MGKGELKDWFCLKNREKLTIDPKINPNDGKYYFCRKEIKERIIEQLQRSFIDPGVPKMIIYGSYGSGKTQTLYYIKHYLENHTPEVCREKPVLVHLDLEMKSKSNCWDWHLQLMEALGIETLSKWIEGIISEGEDIEEQLKNIFKDDNYIKAIKDIRVGGEQGLLAWRWLCGKELKPNELQKLKVTRSLGEVGSSDLVNVLLGIGALAKKRGYKLIFLIDEAEQFLNVKNEDSIESLHNYLRKLAEPINEHVGFVIATFGVTQDQMAEFLVREDIKTRIGESNFIEIPPFPDIENVEIFIKELISEFIDLERVKEKFSDEGKTLEDEEIYPFNREAFYLLCEYATADPTKAIPRNILKAVNECAVSTYLKKKLYIDKEIVDNISSLVFG